MEIKRHILMCGIAAALLFPTTAIMANSSDYDLGQQASESYQYSVALMHFAAAAEHGDKDAQRNLGLMLLYGERLYGAEVHADQPQALRWLKLAASQGDEVSALMLRRHSVPKINR